MPSFLCRLLPRLSRYRKHTIYDMMFDNMRLFYARLNAIFGSCKFVCLFLFVCLFVLLFWMGFLLLFFVCLFFNQTQKCPRYCVIRHLYSLPKFVKSLNIQLHLNILFLQIHFRVSRLYNIQIGHIFRLE